MSTRTDWGIFKRDGSRLIPLAVGDEHWKWECPDQKWETVDLGPHSYDGSDMGTVRQSVNCPWQNTAPKTDTCSMCGRVFIYP